MTALLVGSAFALLLTLSAGFVRVLVGPTPSDRMMAAQLIGTTGIATLLVLGQLIQVPALVDVALIFALLAAVAVSAFTRRQGSDPAES